MTSEQINALKNVLILAEEVVSEEYNPFQTADDVIAHNSIKIIRELILEQDTKPTTEADSEYF